MISPNSGLLKPPAPPAPPAATRDPWLARRRSAASATPHAPLVARSPLGRRTSAGRPPSHERRLAGHSARPGNRPRPSSPSCQQEASRQALHVALAAAARPARRPGSLCLHVSMGLPEGNGTDCLPGGGAQRIVMNPWRAPPGLSARDQAPRASLSTRPTALATPGIALLPSCAVEVGSPWSEGARVTQHQDQRWATLRRTYDPGCSALAPRQAAKFGGRPSPYLCSEIAATYENTSHVLFSLFLTIPTIPLSFPRSPKAGLFLISFGYLAPLVLGRLSVSCVV